MSDKGIKISLEVGGMTCASCALSVESMLKSQKGVNNATVNYANRSVILEYEPDSTNLETLKKITKSIGYELFIEELSLAEKEEKEHKRFYELKKKLIIAIVFTLPVFIISMFFHHLFNGQNYLLLLLTIPVIFISGAEFYITAWKQTMHRMANMDTLVALGTGVAFIYSVLNSFFPTLLNNNSDVHVYYESASVIITLILLGRFLEERAKTRASSSIKKLMDLQPKTVTVIRYGREIELNIKDVIKGDEILIKPGEKITVDGKVTDGTSFIDESMITGEPIPINKAINDKVFAGTLNQNGTLTIVCEKTGRDTLLSQIIRRVQEAQASKPPIQKLVDKIASVFVPVVIAAALLTFVMWFFVMNAGFAFAITNTITVLIIACPCALGLATPTALMVGLGKSAEHGILVKDADSLEVAHKINAMVFDKTGTITEGKPKVTDLIWTSTSQSQAILFAIEFRSAHPLANSIVNHLKDIQKSNIPFSKYESIPGKGIKAIYNNIVYLVGNAKLLADNNISISTEQQVLIDNLTNESKTIILFADNSNLLAIIAVADQIKETSYEGIKAIKALGIKTFLLTGDNNKTASIIAQKAGIDTIVSEVLPTQKADFIKDLQVKGLIVAMVGDGINDAIALTQANIGIAMAHGSDIAMESAGITLIHSDMKQILGAIKLSKATIKTIKQNLFWAFIYNIIAIPIAAGVMYPFTGFLLNPMIAAATMAMSSVSVVTNSLRLKNTKL